MQGTLLLLSKLRLLAQWRKMKRTLASPAGIVLALVTLGFFAMILLLRVLGSSVPRAELTPMANWFFRPAMLFLLWLFTILGSRFKSPIAFSMAEVEFLFSGPFTRRQLLVHKLMISTLGPLGFALMTPLLFPFVWWPAAIVGILLMATFMQWWTILMALAIGWIGARYRALRWAAALAVAALAIVSFWQAGVFSADMEVRPRLLALESSWASRIVLAPFVVFSHLISASSVGPMLAWSAGALAMVLGVAVSILSLDAHFLEVSLEASRRRYETLQRLKRSGGASSFRLPSRPRFTLPRLPRLLGAGPIAWRQGLESLRSSGGPILMFAVPAAIGLAAGVAIIVAARGDVPTSVVMICVTLGVGVLVTMSMPLAMRADLAHVEIMKTLPIDSSAIVCGSVAAGILYVTTLQLITVISMAILLGEWFGAAGVALVVALPINVLTVAFDSVLVLLFPSIRQLIPGDPLVGMWIMLVSLAKIVFVFGAAGVASVPVVAVWLVLGDSLPVLMVTGYAMLLVEGLATVWLAVMLFAHFDVSAIAQEA